MDIGGTPRTSIPVRTDQGPDLAGRTDRVSFEVINMLGNAILPCVRSADLLTTSLWKKPVIMLHTRNVAKLLKTEEYFQNMLKAAKPPKPEEEILTLTID
ncbi:unnamed protein product [Allacma fusca]|uniref:Uncharacterized protein n=1 Tax=Allacma fusca TaxID=39272 RepID=A0A8J2PCQ2_9HEXA|nr:unnamed protein product [Allacma fusca]